MSSEIIEGLRRVEEYNDQFRQPNPQGRYPRCKPIVDKAAYEKLENDAIKVWVSNEAFDFRPLEAETLNRATPNDSTLTLENLLAIKRKFGEERNRFQITLGEYTFNLMDYEIHETKLLEGGILLIDRSRTTKEKSSDPKPTDKILIDVQGERVLFCAGSSRVKFKK